MVCEAIPTWLDDLGPGKDKIRSARHVRGDMSNCAGAERSIEPCQPDEGGSSGRPCPIGRQGQLRRSGSKTGKYRRPRRKEGTLSFVGQEMAGDGRTMSQA
jgi:hypothetical protein